MPQVLVRTAAGSLGPFLIRHMSSIVLDWLGVRQAQIRGAAAAPANRAAESWRA